MSRGMIALPSVMDIYDVKEMFSRYYVDPEAAQKLVPSKWEVKVHENGKAVLLVMVQNCKKMVLDCINIGTVLMSHIWIEIKGPDEVVTMLPGTTRSLPTWYWYILPHQLGAKKAYIFFKIAGVSSRSVEKISLGGDPGVTRFGEVIENYSPEAKYEWTETSHMYEKPDIVTGSHRFYRKYGIRESTAHAKCFTHFLGESEVNLKASPSSTIAKLGFGTSLTGFSHPVWVKHCKVHYKVSYY